MLAFTAQLRHYSNAHYGHCAPLNQPLSFSARTVSFNFTSEEEDQEDQPTTSLTSLERLSGNDQAPDNGGRNQKQIKNGRKKVRKGDGKNPPHNYITRRQQRTR